MSFEYWFMFPVSILVATTPMASGVEGATFFTPIFLLAMGMPVEVAVGTYSSPRSSDLQAVYPHTLDGD